MSETETNPKVQNFKPAKTDDTRKCIVSQDVFEKTAMLRFVVSPDKLITPDVKNNLPGRGAWVTADRKMVEQAVDKGAFNRAFKQKVKPMEGLTDIIESLLKKAVFDGLSLCRKSGDLQMGHLKAEESILSGRTRIYVVANDAGTDTRKKLTAKMRTIAEKKGKKCYIIDHFSSAELIKCLGQEKVIHVAIKTGPLAMSLLAKIEKWDRYNGKQNMIKIIGE
ncbi:MAG: RNA-binding protein [Rhizobiales bacterium]|nr:RNA-binding protein [Hyphomicrobiales bacterium]NRB15243.1 RNA-binding protein [Hyphomicrobiales bacterium]